MAQGNSRSNWTAAESSDKKVGYAFVTFFLNYSVPLWAALVSLIFLFRHFEPARLTQPLLVRDLRDALAWTFIAFIATAGLFILFKQIANYAQQVITRHVPKTRFQLTNGDTNRQAREKRNATTKIIKSGLGFLATLICNLLAAYIFARIFYTK